MERAVETAGSFASAYDAKRLARERGIPKASTLSQTNNYSPFAMRACRAVSVTC